MAAQTADIERIKHSRTFNPLLIGFHWPSKEDQPVSFDIDYNSIREAILNPLRVLSYWSMKDRARKIGESGGFNLLKSLQQNSKPMVRFYLVGHSFGCIVASAIVNGDE